MPRSSACLPSASLPNVSLKSAVGMRRKLFSVVFWTESVGQSSSIPYTTSNKYLTVTSSTRCSKQVILSDGFQTTVPHIYDVGDAIGPPSLGSASVDQVCRAIASHAEIARGQISALQEGFIKMVADGKDEKILGLHVLGLHVLGKTPTKLCTQALWQ